MTPNRRQNSAFRVFDRDDHAKHAVWGELHNSHA
jgi:hypothetical protein